MGIQTKKRLIYIDSLKLLLCLLVFFGHFYYGLYTSANNTPDLSSSVVSFRSVIHFFTNRVFTVASFSFLSGYFVSQKTDKIRDILFQTIKRYLRFVFPLLFTFLFVSLLWSVTHFEACSKLAAQLNSDWLAGNVAKDYSVLKVFRAAFIDTMFFGRASFDNPVWMLSKLFFGYIAATVIVFLLNRKKPVFNVFSVLICLAATYYSFITIAVILGMLYRRYEQKINFKPVIFALLAIASVLIGSFRLYDVLPVEKLSELFRTVLSVLIIVGIIRIPVLTRALSCKAFEKLSVLSFPVYLLHMPLIISIACSFIYYQQFSLGYTASYLLAELITFAAVIALSIIWHFTADKLSNTLSLLVLKPISKLLYKKCKE